MLVVDKNAHKKTFPHLSFSTEINESNIIYVFESNQVEKY